MYRYSDREFIVVNLRIANLDSRDNNKLTMAQIAFLDPAPNWAGHGDLPEAETKWASLHDKLPNLRSSFSVTMDFFEDVVLARGEHSRTKRRRSRRRRFLS